MESSNSVDIPASTTTDSEPVSLEGELLCRKGRSTGHSSLLWKRHFVLLDLTYGGSIAIYKEPPEHSGRDEQHAKSTVLRTVYSKLHRSLSMTPPERTGPQGQWPTKSMEDMFYMVIPAHLPWVVKDMQNDSSAFVIEIPTGKHEGLHLSDTSMASYSQSDDIPAEHILEDSEDEEENVEEGQAHLSTIISGEEVPPIEMTKDLKGELVHAQKRGKPFRVYFRCNKGGNEKALWLQSFSRLGRLSTEVMKKKGFFSPLRLGQNRVRIRSRSGRNFARETRQLEVDGDSNTESGGVVLSNDVEELVRGPAASSRLKDKEFRVLPVYAYPHRWMSRSEMREEMVPSSAEFHDLRIPGCKQKEIGSLEVEVLQCLGLPKLDRTADTDAVVYFVCGSYAFSTDVIPNRSNPIWLRKSRRACSIPLFHAYARLYAGVFDDDGRRIKDDFAGRVVLDLARLRPGSSYDVTLPLRLSTHVYSRRRRGAIRLRFTLNWKSERAALLSYIPRKINIPLPQHSKPDNDTTVVCADPKAFRNIAITVHGAHLPGRFTFPQMRATIREFNFTRKFILTAVRQHLREMRLWMYPSLSAFVFCTWMHAVYANAFSLVPAYAVVYLLLLLMRSYVRHGIDAPGQRGFVPPSWEEMFMALLNRDPKHKAIEPLDFGLRPLSLARRHTSDTLGEATFDAEMLDYRITTHEPKGKGLFKMLGFLPDRSMACMTVEEDHLEFPFSNGTDYPKFTVKECFVERKGESAKDTTGDNRSSDRESAHITNSSGEPRYPRFPLEVEMPDLLHKDSSGMRDRDDEEEFNFAARRAVMANGKRAAGKLGKAATGIGDVTGLNYVVSPIRSGIASGVNQVATGVYYAAGAAGMHTTTQPKDAEIEPAKCVSEPNVGYKLRRTDSSGSDITDVYSMGTYDMLPADADISDGMNGHAETIDPDMLYPEQNIDIEGPSSGKKLTDEFLDIKDKMHELTWHLFDDKTYVMKNPNSKFFGQGKKPDKRRKKPVDVSLKLDKLLHVGQYSHTNPFIARLGLFGEPIISSVYSFLCLFRAGFNIGTWRDPMLTFWVSIFGVILAAILFVFPWRIFMFVVGVAVVGPQNWLLRVLRECGRLPPARVRKHPREDEEEEFDATELPTDQPVFRCHSRQQGNAPEKLSDVEPRELQRIVVPYKPLIYQRFYDWPPEPQYAQVKVNSMDEQRRKSLQSVIQQRQTGSNEVGRFRRRFHRKNNTADGFPPLDPRRRANTGDWPGARLSSHSPAGSASLASPGSKKET